MRTALDRLLARPSTLRVLRSLIAQEELSFAALSRPRCQLLGPPAPAAPAPIKARSYTFFASRFGTRRVDDKAASNSQTAPVPEVDAKLPANPAEVPFDRWIEILHFQQRLYGEDGVKAVWKELRIGKLDLPTAGEWAQSFWEIFLACDDIRQEVVAHAEDLESRTGLFYKQLYESIIARCFAESRPADVYVWHDRLISTFPLQEGALRRIATSVGGAKASIKAFRYIYACTNQRDVYDALIPSLCNRGRWLTALKCHQWLVDENDLPSASVTDSAIGIDFQNALSEIKHSKARTESRYKHAQQSPNVLFSRESMNRILGEVHDIRPKKLDDHFCARIFATKAFSIDAILRGLGMFGVEEIGPLALREMASRTNDHQNISYNIKRLEEARISIGKSVYSLALRKFADDGRQDLINALISTDQHPDAFEDTKLQRQLLTTFIKRGDWGEVHRTLAILTVFHEDPVKEQWNILVQKLSSLRDRQTLCKVLEDMQSQKITLTMESMSALQAHQLRPRKPGKAPVADPLGYDDTTLVANIWRSILMSGGHVEPRRWTEIFKRYGTTERFDEVAKLALWLADRYSHRADGLRLSAPLRKLIQRKNTVDASILHRALRSTHPAHPLNQIFPPEQLRAFVSWGVRRAFVLLTPDDPDASQKPPHYWAQGIHLCKLLRERGVYVRTDPVRNELRRQLLHLFGPGRSYRTYNRRSVRHNPYSVLEMIEGANQLWNEAAGKPLLDPKELVSGTSSRIGMWWARRMRWDVLRQVQSALGGGNLPDSLQEGEWEMAMMQETGRNLHDDGQAVGDTSFVETEDLGEEAVETDDLGEEAVETDDLVEQAVETDDLVEQEVETDDFVEQAVQTDDLGEEAVEADNLDEEAFEDDDLGEQAAEVEEATGFDYEILQEWPKDKAKTPTSADLWRDMLVDDDTSKPPAIDEGRAGNETAGQNQENGSSAAPNANVPRPSRRKK
ncbi:hypothetical protein SLS56_006585 [Neofusicoccum ribis]|uniref:Pentatricopeptide repeat domain-containing protein n=1 Tax=Neofusicoccum ribis TaxID=45134 RepID=A0ABR3SQ97_9PEZI